ncbi:DUF1493 family protein [Serratia ficaria]|uniref:DUF1493 family protein n=1 Tax=Serratia ficaria TaxID=61651 RepID=UPI000E24F2F1|nr:DUF1493 family protein [Serratia ficaria]REF42073.1 uncharacterized protein DUF1493 [Serratia ficaria]CAI0822208.1 Protein of uncharacterised function (DUF1493) [Serratia ficaria]CAI1051586.1 Protein of uncharacterised function (DUF1493) [Serratia ficaria]CAI1099907.1 Protein of uncharacterised function (DUF1493) [Serratia ficaria]CAI1194780.1 Protein of uncharacterised function (DUF1493) [Serratia ficaria]
MNKADDVRDLIRKHFWAMPDDASLSTGKKSVLSEDAYDFLEEYSNKLNVDMTDFDIRKYFPNSGIRFIPNAILPKYLQTDHHEPEALTISMLIESAEAGRWLY